MKAVVAGVALAAFLAGCTNIVDRPQTGDQVRDAATAIALGKKVCLSTEANPQDYWTADYNAGDWEVRHVFVGGYPGCKWDHVMISARNGSASGCGVCVVPGSSG